MKFTVNGTTHDFDPSRLTFAEGRAIEKVSGMAFKELGAAAESGSMTAMQALLWVAMKRTTPTLRFSDLDDMVLADIDFARGELAEATGGEVAPDLPPAFGARVLRPA